MRLPDSHTPLELSPTIHGDQLLVANDEANDQGSDLGQPGSPAFFDDDVLQTKPGSDECIVQNEFAQVARVFVSASRAPRAGVMTRGIKTHGLILWDGILLCCGTLMRSSKTRTPLTMALAVQEPLYVD